MNQNRNKKSRSQDIKHPITDSLKRFLHTPEAELSRWQYAVRYLFNVCRHGVRQLREDRAGQMAAALAFRTLFGLVPILAIGMVLFQAFGGEDVFADLIHSLAKAGNLTDIKMPESDRTLVDFFLSLITDITDKISFKSIGVVGLLLLGWAAIGLLSNIEKSFNAICRAPGCRPLRVRVPLFWMAITIGPLLIYFSFSIQSRFNAWVETVQAGAFFVWLLGLFTSYCTTWLLLLMLYRYMPNIRMGLRPAAVGSFVAALLWTIATRLLTGYMANAFSGGNASYAVLYSSLGLIPIFMLWVYFIWVIILFGLEVTSTLQTVGGSLLDPRALPITTSQEPTLIDYTQVLLVMQTIAKSFNAGKPIESAAINAQTNLDPTAITTLLKALHTNGFIHPVKGHDDPDSDFDDPENNLSNPAWTLAQPADQITAADLLKSALRAIDPTVDLTTDPEESSEPPSIQTALGKLRTAQLTAASEISLSDLLD